MAKAMQGNFSPLLKATSTSEYANQCLKSAKAHGVVALLFKALQNINKPEQQLLYKLLSKQQQHQQKKLAFLDASAISTLNFLQQKGAKFVVLKGFALAYSVYNKPELRQRADIDIFIHPSSKQEFLQLMAESGYANPRGWLPEQISQQFSMRKVISPGLSLDFDIHTHISNDTRIKDWLSFDETYENAQNTPNLGSVPLIPKHLAFMHAILHLLHHRQEGDLLKLVWFYDIYLLAEKLNANERKALIEVAAQKGISNILHYGIHLSEQYFRSSSLSELKQALKGAKGQARYLFLKNLPSKSAMVFTQLNARGLSKDTITMLIEMIFPPAAEIRNKYGHVSSLLLPFYYVRRILGGLVKRFF